MKTPTWQLSTLPRWLHHCRFTPTEWVPRLGKLLGSKAMMPSGSPNRSTTCPTNTVTNGWWLLLDSRVVDLTMPCDPIVVTLSSLKPLFFKGLQNELRFSDNL